jgi:hypothetical protein
MRAAGAALLGFEKIQFYLQEKIFFVKILNKSFSFEISMFSANMSHVFSPD